MTRVIICGGGLSGSLAAIALAKRRPDIDLLLIESGQSFGGNHIWSFFDSDIAPGCQWLLGAVATRRWPDHEIRFPKRSRILPLGYNSIRSHDLDTAVRTALCSDQYRLGEKVSELGPSHVLSAGKRIEADCVIDARGPGSMPNVELGWQKFVGRVYRFSRAHGVVRPMIMDGTVEQVDGFRFAYLLPLSPTELLVEDTYYSSSPLFDLGAIGSRLEELSSRIGRGDGETVSEEQGRLPVVIDGDFENVWPSTDLVPRLGLAGGFFHPTTGYSLPDALATAVLLAKQPELRVEAVFSSLRERAGKLWSERQFFQLLNRMLFRAAEPAERYRVLEHFYRLPQAVISRFYSARLTTFDKFRILSGRPPVPIGRALSSLRRKAA